MSFTSHQLDPLLFYHKWNTAVDTVRPTFLWVGRKNSFILRLLKSNTKLPQEQTVVLSMFAINKWPFVSTSSPEINLGIEGECGLEIMG